MSREPEMSDAFEQTVLLSSSWSTGELIAMALSWCEYDDGVTPVWWRIDPSSPEEAAAFYAEQPDELRRELVVDALVSAGWTRSRINWRKS